jgi:hypothetical protein
MKVLQVIGKALAWFNLVCFGLMVVQGILQAVAMANLVVLIAAVLLAAVPLNGYAGLQLHRSIKNPEIKLSHQTPVGIRFVGIVVILIGIFMAGVGLIMILAAKDILQVWKENAMDTPKLLDISSASQLQAAGAELLFFGLIMLAGALINMRLLRWYYLVKQSDVS